MNVIHAGSIAKLTSASKLEKKLAVGVYDIQLDQYGQYELHSRPSFQMPEKIYGGHDDFSDRALATFKALGKGMATLLSGPKGCGKTLTAKKLGLDSGMPVLCMTAPLHGMGLTSFLTEIPNPCVIFIDEFEKLYKDTDDRNSFLTLLDGASDNKHLFVMTSNSEDIGEFFCNRPGRVRYHRKYEEMDDSLLFEIIRDKMPAGKLRKSVEKLVEELGTISPDALTSLISEVLIHQEEPSKFMHYFNIETELSGYYNVDVQTAGFIPKPGLSKRNLDAATRFINEIHENNLFYARHYYGDAEKYCEPIIEEWKSHHTRPFHSTKGQNGRVGDPAGISANVNFAENGRGKYRNFQIQPHLVKSTERKKGAITVEMKDGTIFTFTKSTGLKPYVS